MQQGKRGIRGQEVAKGWWMGRAGEEGEGWREGFTVIASSSQRVILGPDSGHRLSYFYNARANLIIQDIRLILAADVPDCKLAIFKLSLTS